MLRRRGPSIEACEIAIIVCNHEIKTESSFIFLCRFKGSFLLVLDYHNLHHKRVTACKVSVFGVFLVRVFPHSDWMRRVSLHTQCESSVSLHIQSEYGKIRTRKTPNTDTFHALYCLDIIG